MEHSSSIKPIKPLCQARSADTVPDMRDYSAISDEYDEFQFSIK